MLESALVKKIRKNLTTVKGVWVYKTHGGEGTRAGVPDLLLCYAHMFVGVETKAKGNRATELQEGEMAKIGAAGGIAIVAYTVDDVLKVLEAIRPIERLKIVRVSNLEDSHG